MTKRPLGIVYVYTISSSENFFLYFLTNFIFLLHVKGKILFLQIRYYVRDLYSGLTRHFVSRHLGVLCKQQRS